MSKGTTLRNIRVSDNLWDSAKVLALADGTTVSDIVRKALEAYVSGENAKAAEELDKFKVYNPDEVDDALFIVANPNFTNPVYPYGWLNADVWTAEETIAKLA